MDNLDGEEASDLTLSEATNLSTSKAVDIAESDPNETAEDIDLRNSDGLTPLMVACKDLDEKAVEELISKGADPNKVCEKTKNTSLHFVCECGWVEAVDEEGLSKRKRIIQLLFEYGADFTKNVDGFSPLCLAAYTGAKTIVEYFESTPMGNNIYDNLNFAKAYELLGISYTIIQDSDWPWFSDEVCEAADFFAKARTLRQIEDKFKDHYAYAEENGLAEFEKCFIVEEGQKKPEKEAEIYADGWMTAIRILPPHMIDLSDFTMFASGSFLSEEFYGHENGFQMFKYLMNKEFEGSLQLGEVLDCLSVHLEYDEPNHSLTGHILALLDMYADRMNRVENDNLRMDKSKILQDLENILFNLCVYDWPVPFNIDPFVQAAVQITIKCYSAFKRCIYYGKSIVQIMVADLKHMLTTYDIDLKVTIEQRLLHVIRLLLPHDLDNHLNNREIRATSGKFRFVRDSALNLLVECTSIAVDDHGAIFLTCLAKLLIRYGCSIKIKNSKGKTPKAVFYRKCREHRIDPDSPQLDELQTLLSGGLLTLEEMTARVILQHRLPYRDRLPKVLCDLVEGGDIDQGLTRFQDLATNLSKTDGE